MEQIFVLDRVPQRHPDVSKDDAAKAWEQCLVSTPDFDMAPERYLAIGIDGKGRLLELVVVRKGIGLWLIIHAQTPPQEDIRRRLGFENGRRK